mmetsp:Transcript_1670/g.4338  ORF Transcript_1670/g.4338 Transcript_1670/m.4338 type:complete len:704 (+) Transcript_1670:2-2113(+)
MQERIRQGFSARYVQTRSGPEKSIQDLWEAGKDCPKSNLMTSSRLHGRVERRDVKASRCRIGSTDDGSMEDEVGSEQHRHSKQGALSTMASTGSSGGREGRGGRSGSKISVSKDAPAKLQEITIDQLFETAGSVSKVRPHIEGKRTVQINMERHAQLQYIRGTELQDLRELEEDPMPDRPNTEPTFTSASHLKTDDYWQSLLGIGDADRSYCRWADATWFQVIVSIAILTNALLFGMENGEETPLWQLLAKHFVLAFSLFEQVLLMSRLNHGMSFTDKEEQLFCSLDMVAVVGCTVDQWGVRVMLSLLSPDLAQRLGPTLGTVARLLWLMRFLRLTRIVPSLHELLHGVMQALHGLFWVFAFVFMMLYILAVLCTAIIGNGALDKYLPRDSMKSIAAEDVKKEFSSVGKSMFVLFSTMSSWSLMPLIPLFEAAPPTRIFFCVFYVYAGWTLLAVMTGTVSFTMIAIKAQIVGDDENREQEKRQHVIDVLHDIFCQLDEDGSGSLDFEEFKMILKSPDVIRLLQTSTNIKVQDLEELWDFLDDDGSNEVNVDEFMQGFQWLNEDFKPKTLMRMQEKLSQEIKAKHHFLNNLVTERLNNIVEQVERPLRKIHSVSEQVQVLGASMTSLYKEWEDPADLAEFDAIPSKHEVDELGESLEAQIDDILQRLSRFEVTPAEAEEDPYDKKESFKNKRGLSMTMLPWGSK